MDALLFSKTMLFNTLGQLPQLLFFCVLIFEILC